MDHFIDSDDLFDLDPSIFEEDDYHHQASTISFPRSDDCSFSLPADFISGVGFGSDDDYDTDGCGNTNNNTNNYYYGVVNALSSSAESPRPNNNNNSISSSNGGDDRPPQLMLTTSSGTRIYRSACQTVGIKVVMMIDPTTTTTNNNNNNNKTEETMQKKLLHEETVSKRLPSECNKRQVITVGSFQDSPALYFKWEKGITGQEWLYKVLLQLQQQQQQQQTPFLPHKNNNEASSSSSIEFFHIRLRAAMAIAKTLHQFHSNYIVYNALSLDNIVLIPVEGEYVAKFIDLSDAIIVICSDDDDNNDGQKVEEVEKKKKDFDKMKVGDMISLGLILDQLFRMDDGGHDDVEAVVEGGIRSISTDGTEGSEGHYSNIMMRRGGGEEEQEQTSSDNSHIVRKRGKRQHLTPSDGLPLYLRAMISTLLLLGGDDKHNTSQLHYESAYDVYEDLKVMATTQSISSTTKETELDHEVLIHSRLKLPKDLFYGRQVQMAMMTHLLQSVTMLGDQPLMALIAGYPGTGKSTLVNQIKKPLAEKNGCLIQGKFDIAARPDKVLASALDSFFANINATNAGEDTYMSMRWRITDAIGSGVSSLFDSIPSLHYFLNNGTEVDDCSERRMIDGNLMDQRLKYMFCKLIGAISCRSQPLVLVLDDLQWADEMTLGVIRMLMTDPDIRNFLFLGCYRDNEVNESHMLSAKLKDIREQGINFTTIKVAAIEKESVNALISDVMCLPPNLCRSLSTVVHQKTGGIIMFVLRLLASLNDEGFVWYSVSSRRWMFDLQKIELREISEDVVKHMTEHMRRLPEQMQMGLKLCACLGSNFDATILCKATKGADVGDDFLQSCVDDGFLQIEGDSSYYRWAHDQVRQAAYELIPLQQRDQFHLLIGSRLLLSTTSSEIETYIFYVTDNLNMGTNLLNNPEQKYEVAELNLKAGEKLLKQQSFHSAVKYLITGISLLEDDSWGSMYSLTLRLHDAASEALCVIGDYPTLTALSKMPLHHARCFDDKLNTYSNLVRALSSSGNIDECIDTCVSVLSQLGESLPTKVTPEVYFDEVAKVRQSLMGLSRQDLWSLPLMTDLNKLTAMQFLNHMLIVTYTAKPPLNPIVVFRMMKMSVDFGVCNISAIAFSCYGAWLASSLNDDYDAAFAMGRFASELMKKLSGAESVPRIYAVVYGMINFYKEPLQASLCKHSEAFDAGLIHGDVEYAVSNIAFYYTLALFGCGSNLHETSQNIHKHIKRAIQYNQHLMVKNMLALQQMTYDLMGIQKNAYEDHFSGLNEDAVKAFSIKNKLTSFTRTLYQEIRYVKYMCGDMDAAAKHYDLQQELYANCAGQATTGRTFFFCITTFIDGLIGLYFARKHREDEAKWTNVAEKAVEFHKRWADSSSWNFANKLSLLQAENFFLMDDERAYACYKTSIKKAREHKFNHEEGLAHEKLATYLLHKNKHDEALQHFQNAKKCYEIWGASILVQRVEKAIAVLSPLCIGSIEEVMPSCGT